MASVTTVSHLLRHSISAWLSRDQKVRVGFEEPDKLWEVLKVISKHPLPSDILIQSTDLEEATYRIPFKILELNQEFIDRHFYWHPSVRVFKSVLHTHARSVDARAITIPGIPDQWTTTRGAFMGDSLSFMHLTLYMMARDWIATARSSPSYKEGKLAYRAGNKFLLRPFGQIVGDDDLEFADARYAESSDEFTILTGGKMSKIHALSPDAGMLCENYFVKPADPPENYDHNSQFGELFFLDVIKGSTLSGQSKVQAEGQKPAVGHAKLVATQTSWHPVPWIRERAPVLLFAKNFRELIGLGRSKAWLPQVMGGLGINSVGLTTADTERNFAGIAPYYEGILQLAVTDIKAFVKYYVLLQSISKPSPKGFDFFLDPEQEEHLKGLEVQSTDEVYSSLPSWAASASRPTREKLVREQFGFVPLVQLASTLARVQAFAEFWAGKLPTNRAITLSPKAMAKRYSSVWKIIKSEVTPISTDKTIGQVEKAMKTVVFSIFFNEDSPAIRSLYGGIASVHLDLRQLLIVV
jgi:hypothetical protein